MPMQTDEVMSILKICQWNYVTRNIDLCLSCTPPNWHAIDSFIHSTLETRCWNCWRFKSRMVCPARDWPVVYLHPCYRRKRGFLAHGRIKLPQPLPVPGLERTKDKFKLGEFRRRAYTLLWTTAMLCSASSRNWMPASKRWLFVKETILVTPGNQPWKTELLKLQKPVDKCTISIELDDVRNFNGTASFCNLCKF